MSDLVNIPGEGREIARLGVAQIARPRMEPVCEACEPDPSAALINRLEDALAGPSRRRTDRAGALFLVDIDDFRGVAELLGRRGATQFLSVAQRRLRQAARAGDVVARFADDAFLVLVFGALDEGHCDQIAERLLAAVAACDAPGLEAFGRVSASIGVARFPADGGDADSVLRSAQLAVRAAKSTVRGGWCYCEPAARDRAMQRVALRRAFAEALKRKDFEVALQPQLCLKTGRHRGFEALARWTADGAPISPAVFIPIAESSQLIHDFGAMVLNKALAAYRRLKDEGLAPGVISVNALAPQLESDRFVAIVLEALWSHGLPAHVLEIEITETALTPHSAPRVGPVLTELKAAGVRVALDDFGMGSSSLAHLREFPVDVMKIDRSFVADVETAPGGAQLTEAIVSLGGALGLTVVAEGIETEAQLDFLRRAGCHVGQGFLFARPGGYEDAAEYLRRGLIDRAALLQT